MSMMIAAVDEFEMDSIRPMVLERRVSTRIRLSRPIRVIDLVVGRHAAGRSRDISSTGMQLQIPMTHQIVQGDTIQVDVGTLAGVGPLAGRPRVIPARVVWLRREGKMLRPMLTIGVEFELDHDAMMNVA